MAIMASAASIITSSSADNTIIPSPEQTSNTVATAPSSVIVQAKSHQQIDLAAVASDTCRSASAAVKQSGGECTAATSADPELVPQTDELETQSEQGCCTESPSVAHESHRSSSSPDNDKEAESSTLDGSSSHTEDEGEGEETDICSSPPGSEAEDVDIETSAVKKPKNS